MRKVFTKIVAALCCMAVSFAFVGCMGGQLVQKIDPNKTQIYVNVYNGGNGCDWIKKLAQDFNSEYDDSGYEVIIIDNTKLSVADILTEISTGTKTEVYFTVEPNVKDMVAQDLLEDISDVYDMKVDGENGKTIGEKMHDPDMVKEVFAGKQGKGLYGLPYSTSFLGLVYEHERFLENEWYLFADSRDESVKAELTAQGITYSEPTDQAAARKNRLVFESAATAVNYKKGDLILTPGKDGKYGTYDDGQPQNMTEWETLLKRVKSSGGYPLLWSGANGNYLDDIITAAYAQYDGIENFELFLTYDGTYVSPTTGEETVITPDKGNQIFRVSEGFKKGVEFIDKYFTKSAEDNKYVHPFATYDSTSHRDAQDKFLYGYQNKGEVYLTAMLADGIWWENEAKASFNSVASSSKDSTRAYGGREYRYMLLPAMEGQKGIDGNGNGSVFAVRDNGAVLVKKNSDRKLVEWAKKFVAYTTSNESLRYFTKTTGVVRPYDYELTEEDLASMTPFQRNVWTMFSDKENIALVKPYMLYGTSSVNYAGGRSKWIYLCDYEGAATMQPVKILKRTDADGFINSFTSTYNDSKWKGFYDTAIAQWGGLH